MASENSILEKSAILMEWNNNMEETPLEHTKFLIES